MLTGAGVVAPLEGQVVSARVVVNGYTALEHLRAKFFYDYTPRWQDTRRIPMWRAGDIGGAAWNTYLANHAPVTLVLNEPNNANKDGDDATASDLAARLRGVPLAWCGPNVMYGVGSSRRWVTDYVAAGGDAPSLYGLHAYAQDGAELRRWIADERAWLDGIGWGMPLVLTEVGPRPGSGDAMSVLRGVFRLWREGVVQAFFWFASIYDEDGGMWAAGNLLRKDGSLLPLGEEYRALATGQKQTGSLDKHIWLPVFGR